MTSRGRSSKRFSFNFLKHFEIVTSEVLHAVATCFLVIF